MVVVMVITAASSLHGDDDNAELIVLVFASTVYCK